MPACMKRLAVNINPLFLTGSDKEAMKGLLAFLLVALIVITVLLVIGQFVPAVLAAASAIAVETVVIIRKRVQLKVRLGLVMALYGAAIILLMPLFHH